MPVSKTDSLYVAASVADAVAALADRGAAATVMAGATWTMRTPLRGDNCQARSYVAISKIQDFRRIEISENQVVIGSCVTHAELVAGLPASPEFHGLAMAAESSANPAIRQVATIGGNLCAADFPAADLVPALLSLDAEIELETLNRTVRLTLEEFLRLRASSETGYLLSRVIIPRRAIISAHARLPLRKAGDYPVAIVNLSLEKEPGGVIRAARIAVGSVERVAKRWRRLETAMVGRRIDPIEASKQALAVLDDFAGRDGVEAAGWYRVQVLPTLVRRAIEALQ